MSVAFIVGPSGAGKTRIGEWAEIDLRLQFFEADVFGLDGIKKLRLRSQWDAFFKQDDAHSLVRTLKSRAKRSAYHGALLGLPSPCVLSPSQIDAAESAGATILVAWGAEAHCLDAFTRREEMSGRGLEHAHWHRYNDHCHRTYGQREYDRNRLETFRPDGTRRSRSELIKEIAARLGLSMNG